MLDLGIFTVPLLGAMSVFLVAFFTGDAISFDDISTPADMQWNGYDTHVVTRLLLDDLRALNEDAQSEAAGLAVDASYVDQSLGQYADYFGIGRLVDTTRNLVGANQYYISSEIAHSGEKIVYTARLYTPKSDIPVDTVQVEGDPLNPAPMLQEAALELLTDISPYIVALHYFKQETQAYLAEENADKAGQTDASKPKRATAANLNEATADERWSYPKSRAILRQHIETPPPDNNYLAYDLVGRMHRMRAENAGALTADQRHGELQEAVKDLTAALRQNPDFLYSNFVLGVVYEDLQDYANAETYFAKAARIDPNFLPVRQHWARMLAGQGRTREAIFQYVAAVEIDPASPDLRDKLAELYFKLNYTDAALTQWQVAESLDPTNGHFQEMLDKSKPKSP